METQWTKRTLRARIVDMQTNIDRIMKQSNFTIIQRKVLLDFRKRAQAATRVFMEKYREERDTYILPLADTQHVIDQYNEYFNALEKQRKNPSNVEGPPPRRHFQNLPFLHSPAMGLQHTRQAEQHVTALSMPSLHASGSKWHSTSPS